MPLSSPKIAPKPAAETAATGADDADIAAKHKKELFAREGQANTAVGEAATPAMATAVTAAESPAASPAAATPETTGEELVKHASGGPQDKPSDEEVAAWFSGRPQEEEDSHRNGNWADGSDDFEYDAETDCGTDDEDGSYPFRCSAVEDDEGGDLERAAGVLVMGANAGKAVDVDARGGETPLHCAAAGGHTAIIDTLIAHGADMEASTHVSYYNTTIKAESREGRPRCAWRRGEATPRSHRHAARTRRRRRKAADSRGMRARCAICGRRMATARPSSRCPKRAPTGRQRTKVGKSPSRPRLGVPEHPMMRRKVRRRVGQGGGREAEGEAIRGGGEDGCSVLSTRFYEPSKEAVAA